MSKQKTTEHLTNISDEAREAEIVLKALNRLLIDNLQVTADESSFKIGFVTDEKPGVQYAFNYVPDFIGTASFSYRQLECKVDIDMRVRKNPYAPGQLASIDHSPADQNEFAMQFFYYCATNNYIGEDNPFCDNAIFKKILEGSLEAFVRSVKFYDFKRKDGNENMKDVSVEVIFNHLDLEKIKKFVDYGDYVFRSGDHDNLFTLDIKDYKNNLNIKAFNHDFKRFSAKLCNNVKEGTKASNFRVIDISINDDEAKKFCISGDYKMTRGAINLFFDLVYKKIRNFVVGVSDLGKSSILNKVEEAFR